MTDLVGLPSLHVDTSYCVSSAENEPVIFELGSLHSTTHSLHEFTGEPPPFKCAFHDGPSAGVKIYSCYGCDRAICKHCIAVANSIPEQSPYAAEEQLCLACHRDASKTHFSSPSITARLQILAKTQPAYSDSSPIVRPDSTSGYDQSPMSSLSKLKIQQDGPILTPLQIMPSFRKIGVSMSSTTEVIPPPPPPPPQQPPPQQQPQQVVEVIRGPMPHSSPSRKSQQVTPVSAISSSSNGKTPLTEVTTKTTGKKVGLLDTSADIVQQDSMHKKNGESVTAAKKEGKMNYLANMLGHENRLSLAYSIGYLFLLYFCYLCRIRQLT